MNIYVGNLSYKTTEDDLKQTFEPYGRVDSARIIVDKYTDQSRGFGFVEMADATEAQSAINALNGKDIGGRPLVVNEARPRAEGGRSSSGGGGGRSGGGSRARSW